MKKEIKPWYKSNTKKGAVLLGVSAIAGAGGAYFSGTLDLFSALCSALTGLGVILSAFGIRNKLDELKI